MNPFYLTAASGLIGVVIGGLITASSSFLLDRRRENRERDKEHREQCKEIRRAARLIDYEFGHARAAVATTVDNRMWYDDDTKFKMRNWFDHLPVIAAELTYDQWKAVCIADAAFDQCVVLYSRFYKGTPEVTNELKPELIKFLRKKLSEIDNGRAAVEHLVGNDNK